MRGVEKIGIHVIFSTLSNVGFQMMFPGGDAEWEGICRGCQEDQLRVQYVWEAYVEGGSRVQDSTVPASTTCSPVLPSNLRALLHILTIWYSFPIAVAPVLQSLHEAKHSIDP